MCEMITNITQKIGYYFTILQFFCFHLVTVTFTSAVIRN